MRAFEERDEENEKQRESERHKIAQGISEEQKDEVVQRRQPYVPS